MIPMMDRLVLSIIFALQLLNNLQQGVIATSKTVDIIKSVNLNDLEDEKILEVLSLNKSENIGNFTIEEIINRLENRTDNPEHQIWKFNETGTLYTNYYYGKLL